MSDKNINPSLIKPYAFNAEVIVGDNTGRIVCQNSEVIHVLLENGQWCVFEVDEDRTE